VIADQHATESVPQWASAESQDTAARATLVVKVRHEQEGDVTVHLCAGSGDLLGTPTWSGTLDVTSGELVLAKATGERLAGAPVAEHTHLAEPGRARLAHRAEG
jgi:hypothetical protein